MRGLVQLGVVAFSVGLAVIVGNQLSAEAMAVIVGVVCGVLASIPMSILILVFSKRQGALSRLREPTPAAPQTGMAYPPVVVIQADGRSGAGPIASPWDAPAPAIENQPWKRSFTVVGDEEDW